MDLSLGAHLFTVGRATFVQMLCLYIQLDLLHLGGAPFDPV